MPTVWMRGIVREGPRLDRPGTPMTIDINKAETEPTLSNELEKWLTK